MVVDHHRRGVQPPIAFECSIDVAGTHRRLKSERRTIGLIDGGVDIVVGIDTDDGAEDFLGADLAVCWRIIQHRTSVCAV